MRHDVPILLLLFAVGMMGCNSSESTATPPPPLAPAGGVGISEQMLRTQFAETEYEFLPGEECGRPCLTVSRKGTASAVIKGYGATDGFSEVTVSIETTAKTQADGDKALAGVLELLHPEFADWLRATMTNYNYNLGEWQEKTLGNKSAVFTGSELAGTKTIKLFVRLNQE